MLSYFKLHFEDLSCIYSELDLFQITLHFNKQYWFAIMLLGLVVLTQEASSVQLVCIKMLLGHEVRSVCHTCTTLGCIKYTSQWLSVQIQH